MNSTERLADFVARRVEVGRVRRGAYYRCSPDYFMSLASLPSKEELAQVFLADAEFQSLKLGGWLGSPAGEGIAEAVAEVVPTTLQPEFSLIVEGLKLAADLQKAQGRAQVGAGSIFLLLGGLLVREVLRPPG